ncbi:MAG: DUF4268 domain-containing protein [Chloroflexi bacterium]|nr:DUF4268 domain-containing protein [Chloroflexota bacterium]
MIGKLTRVPLRDVWKREDADLTKWLESNYDVLSDSLDITLVNVERERSAGSFSVDLVGEDQSGGTVVIENQLEKSDHDHLGKLVTYVTALEAKTAIWIVSEPRPEHVRAVAWLNESRSASFYLVKVEAVRIEDSPPAPLFTLIVGPSEEGRNIGETKETLAERYLVREHFWTELLKKIKATTKLHANLSPTKENWISTGAGKSGLSYNYVIRQHDTQVELYIDRGKDTDAENKTIFDRLLQSKSEVETAFGAPLDWQRLEGKRACRVRHQLGVGGYQDEAKWAEVQDRLIDAMVRLEHAFKPYIDRLVI